MSRIAETIETAVDVIERLQNAGHQAMFAGGCVRDMLLGVEPKDFDIATSATPDQVEALFEKTVAVGKSFGVIRVIHDGEEFEVATFRSDGQYTDGRRPDEVKFSGMLEDARRRDLTVNALFFDPISDKIHDWVFGEQDLKDRIIRFVGNPYDRIEEDKLRLLRVIRFASRGGWVVNKDTAQAVKAGAAKVTSVSKERIADELTKIFCNKNAFVGYSNLSAYGLWEHVLPDVPCVTRQHNMLRNAGEKLVNNKVLAWAIILSAVSSEKARNIMADLRFDNKTIAEVVNILDTSAAMIDAKNLRSLERTKLIANKDFHNMMDFLWAGDYKQAHAYLTHVRESTPANQLNPDNLIDGNDLIDKGWKPGKAFKEILAKVKDEQREGRITTREQALSFLENLKKDA